MRRAKIFVVLVSTAMLLAASIEGLPPTDELPPPPRYEKVCPLDVECVKEFHVFTGVVSVMATCLKAPCRAHYVVVGKPKESHTVYLSEGRTIYLNELELFVWDGIGAGSIEMIKTGTYIILNRDYDATVPRCAF
ncbi:MAG: hypothetical protein QXU75_04800 [Candidatus Methanomethylicaceae archaeon]